MSSKITIFGSNNPYEGDPDVRCITVGWSDQGPANVCDIVLLCPVLEPFSMSGRFIFRMSTGLGWMTFDEKTSCTINSDTLLFDSNGAHVATVELLANGGYEVTIANGYAVSPVTRLLFNEVPSMSWEEHAASLNKKGYHEPGAIVRWVNWIMFDGICDGVTKLFRHLYWRYWTKCAY